MKYKKISYGEVWEKGYFYSNFTNIEHTVDKNGFICFTGQNGKQYSTSFTKAGFEALLKSALGHL